MIWSNYIKIKHFILYKSQLNEIETIHDVNEGGGKILTLIIRIDKDVVTVIIWRSIDSQVIEIVF